MKKAQIHIQFEFDETVTEGTQGRNVEIQTTIPDRLDVVAQMMIATIANIAIQHDVENPKVHDTKVDEVQRMLKECIQSFKNVEPKPHGKA